MQKILFDSVKHAKDLHPNLMLQQLNFSHYRYLGRSHNGA
jgi:hypothetical protein